MIDKEQEVVQSAISYGAGCVTMLCGYVVEIGNMAEAFAIIVGSLVVLVRLLHDAVALIRYIKNPKTGSK